LQQKLAVVLSFSSVRRAAGLRPKNGGAGRVRVGMVCGAGAGKISQIPAAAGRV